MKLQFDSRTYTNFILSVIALLLLVLSLKAYQVAVTPSAYAQNQNSGYSTGGRSAPVDLSTVSMTQDIAVSEATKQVAAANQQICRGIAGRRQGDRGSRAKPLGFRHCGLSVARQAGRHDSGRRPRTGWQACLECPGQH